MSKPVVEFHQYHKPSVFYAIDQNFQLQSIFRLFKLVAPANTKSDLERYISSYLNNSKDKTIWSEQQKSFQNLFPPDNNASEKIVQLIIEIAKLKPFSPKSGIIKTKLLKEAHHPIIDRENFYYDPVKRKLNLKICRIKAFKMPIISIVLSELVRIFKSENLIITGFFNEHFVRESSKIF